jgi:hypothetical protein
LSDAVRRFHLPGVCREPEALERHEDHSRETLDAAETRECFLPGVQGDQSVLGPQISSLAFPGMIVLEKAANDQRGHE